MSKHTPGPWEVIGDITDHRATICKFRPGLNIITVSGEYCYRNENDANAHLIAAAPELLEVARAAALFAKGEALPTRQQLLESAQKAIAKARGEA